MKADRVLALCVSDVHLSLAPPPARSAEPDWLAAQERPWHEIKDLVAQHGCPVLCAGDLFDRPSMPSELVNWALRVLPVMHGIPGNHDLPGHAPELVHRSSYQTLVEAGRVLPASPSGTWVEAGDGAPIKVYGVPLGLSPVRPKPGRTRVRTVCLVHEFLWKPGYGYQGAPDDARLSRRRSRYRGYDFVVVGDNHQGFIDGKAGNVVVNCGTLLRRKSHEARYRPRVSLLWASGRATPHYLDTTRDVMGELVEDDRLEVAATARAAFADPRWRGEGERVDFPEAVARALRTDGVKRAMRELVEEALRDAQAK